tara:strand:+ start:882 stop:1820 length:939 start_codon:yes stop_codon:yes gene_type:complete
MISTTDALIIAKQNPYKGTSDQIAKLSISIAKTFSSVSAQEFALYKDKTGIQPKIFSKLKVIGETLLKIEKHTRETLIGQFPESYTAIHILCSLPLENLVLAVKEGDINPKMSVREASTFVQQIRFPNKASIDGEKGRWGNKQEHLFNIVRPNDVPMSKKVIDNLKSEIRQICLEYGAQLQVANPSGTTPLRHQERQEKASYWKSILNKELDQKWFDKSSTSIKKQFNISSLKELHEAPIRTFTSFIIKVEGDKTIFWNDYGKAYISKLQILSELDADTRQRYNYRKRLNSYLQDKKDLKVWVELVLEEGGF